MKRKINVQLSLIALIAIVASVVGVMLVCYRMFQDQVKSDLRKNVEFLASLEMFNSPDALENNAPVHLLQNPQNKPKPNSIRLTWIATNGEVLFDSEIDSNQRPNHLYRPEIQMAFLTGFGETARVSNTLHMNTYYSAKRLDNGSVLRVSNQALSISSVFLAVIPVILITALAVLAMCIMLGRLLTKKLLKPIYEMVEHLDDGIETLTYPELIPLANKIRVQHENILSSALKQLDFTANVSHELKTPLAAISGYAELIANHMIEPEQEEHIHRSLRHNVDRLQSLVNDVVRLSEFEHKEVQRQFSTVNLLEVVEGSVAGLQISAKRRNISLSYSGTNVLFSGDRELIKELIVNLAQNAIQYNNDGGYVTIAVSIEKQRPVLRISDNGIGIPKDKQERVFERFYRVDKGRSRETGGTGLGLAIVKHIIEIHGADLKLESDFGVGTTITITF